MTTLDHALRLCELLEIDLARLYPADAQRGEQWRQVLVSECAEYRMRIANHLRYIQGRRLAVTPSVPSSEVVHEVRDVDGVVVAVLKSTPSVPVSENKTIETRSKLVEEIGESGQVIRVRVLYTMRCEDGNLSITSVHKGYIADMSDLQELWCDCLTVEKE